MNKKVWILALTGILAWSMAFSAGAADTARLIPDSAGTEDTAQPVLDSAQVLVPLSEAEEAESAPLTRGELVAMLHEQAGSPVVNYAMDFSDVEEGDPHAEAIRWAASEGIVLGYEDDTFGDEEAVSRQQMAVILYRYAQHEGKGFTGAWAFPLTFSDAQAVGGYAYEAMCWMTMHGVLEADGDNAIDPQGQVTRQQGEQTMEQFLQCLSE